LLYGTRYARAFSSCCVLSLRGVKFSRCAQTFVTAAVHGQLWLFSGFSQGGDYA